MKRQFVSLFMVMALVAVTCVPSVSAADVYVFERVPDVSFLGDSFEFLPEYIDGDVRLICEGLVPAGSYSLQLLSLDGDEIYSPSPISISYDNTDSEDVVVCYIDSIPLQLVRSDNSIYDFPVPFGAYVIYYGMFDFTLFLLICPNDDGFYDDFSSYVDYLQLASVDVSPSLGSFVSPDVMGGVFSQVLALIPVVLAVVISLCGLRKGVSWLIDVLRRS